MEKSKLSPESQRPQILAKEVKPGQKMKRFNFPESEILVMSDEPKTELNQVIFDKIKELSNGKIEILARGILIPENEYLVEL